MNGDRFQERIEERANRGREGELSPRRLTGRLVFGLVMLVLGSSWTLENLGLMDASDVLRWWPSLLVAYGIVRVIGLDGMRRTTSGVLFMVAGGWLLARELGWITVSIVKFWPLFLIVVGASLVWRSMRGPAPDSGPASRSSYPRPFALMGANVTRVESQELVGFEATAVMAGVELDFNGAKSAKPEIVADVFAWWAGIEVLVPEDWCVICEATPIMGGVENQTKLAPGVEPVTTLIVRGMVVMGGIEIKNGKSDGRFTGMKMGVVANRRGDREGEPTPPTQG